jgi:putative peptidoglycan lipid II flippase
VRDSSPDVPADPAAHDPDAVKLQQPASEHSPEVGERRRMGIATVVFAAATFLSRIAGMVREIASAAVFGATAQWSAFTVAYQVPNLIRSLIADSALTGAFVPVFSELNERGERDRAWRLAGTLASLILVILGPVTMLCAWWTPQIIDLFISRESLGEANFQLAVDLMRIMLPIVVLFALNGLIVGILNACDHFAVPALAPIAWNAAILASIVVAIVAVPDRYDIYLYAIGTLVGTIIQCVLPVPWLRGRGGSLRFRWMLRDPRVKEVLILMAPVTISLGLINLQQLIDTLFASHVPAAAMPEGVERGAGPAILDKAFRLYMLPQGIFSVAVATVFFPVLARFAARRDMDGFRSTVADGLRQIFVLLIPCSVILIVFAHDVVAVLFERGAFDAYQTQAVAAAVIGFTIGLVLNGASLLLIRAFFSLKQTWRPTIVSIVTLGVNILADWVLYRRYGIPGIALATSIVNVVGFTVLYGMLRAQTTRLQTRQTLRVMALALTSSLVASVLAWLVLHGIEQVLGGGGGFNRILALTAAMGVAGAVYLRLAMRLGIIDPRVMAIFRRRTRRT